MSMILCLFLNLAPILPYFFNYRVPEDPDVMYMMKSVIIQTPRTPVMRIESLMKRITQKTTHTLEILQTLFQGVSLQLIMESLISVIANNQILLLKMLSRVAHLIAYLI